MTPMTSSVTPDRTPRKGARVHRSSREPLDELPAEAAITSAITALLLAGMSVGLVVGIAICKWLGAR